MVLEVTFTYATINVTVSVTDTVSVLLGFLCFCTHAAMVTAVPFGYTLLRSSTKPNAPVTVETLVCISVASKALVEFSANICDSDLLV